MRAVAIGAVARALAHAQPAFFVFLGGFEHMRLERRSLVGAVAEGLLVRFSAGAEKIFPARRQVDFYRLGSRDFRFFTHKIIPAAVFQTAGIIEGQSSVVTPELTGF